jgi:F5/8 type C domain/Divergent InlB B-repeat domain
VSRSRSRYGALAGLILLAFWVANAQSAATVGGAPKLTVAVAGKGKVTSAPAGISCPAKCSARGVAGKTFTLTAKAAAGWRFGRWSGACTGSRRCVVTLRGAKTVRATFVPRPVPPPPPTTTTTTTPAADGNLALGKTITASSKTTADYPATSANDGNVETYWESINKVFPQWLQVDLGAATSVSKIVLHLPPDAAWNTRTETLAVSGSTDGTTFSTIVPSAAYTFDPATQNTVTITFAAATVAQLRLTFTDNTGWPAAQVSEFEIYA